MGRGLPMLKDHVKGNVPDKDVLKTMIREEEAKLSGSLMKIKEAKLPVMVICEGWGGAGNGQCCRSPGIR